MKTIIILLIYLLSSAVQAQDVTVLSPTLSIRDAKNANSVDFLAEIDWLIAKEFIIDYLKLSMGYERQDNIYYWSNDYHIRIAGGFFRDFRRDDRQIHTMEVGYLTDRIPYVKAGGSILTDKSNQWFATSIIGFHVNWLILQYQKGKSKTIYNGEITLSSPLRSWWIFETYMNLEGEFYYDTDYKPSRRVKAGIIFKIKMS